MRILITGVGGVLGRRLSTHLRRTGAEVTGIDVDPRLDPRLGAVVDV